MWKSRTKPQLQFGRGVPTDRRNALGVPQLKPKPQPTTAISGLRVPIPLVHTRNNPLWLQTPPACPSARASGLALSAEISRAHPVLASRHPRWVQQHVFIKPHWPASSDTSHNLTDTAVSEKGQREPPCMHACVCDAGVGRCACACSVCACVRACVRVCARARARVCV